MRFFGWLWAFFANLLGGSSTTTTTTSSDDSEISTTTTTTTRTTNPYKRALCIGINDYPGSSSDLRGCVNDAKGWKKMLTENFGFGSVTMLLNNEATYSKVISEMKKLVQSSKAGDVLAITYSGHGTSVRDTNYDEVDGRDEALCLYDKFLIDDNIKSILSGLHPEAKLTFISDSCHSGTVTRAFISAMTSENTSNPAIPRYMPPDDEIEAVAINSLPVLKSVYEPRDNMKEVLIAGCKSTEYSYDASFSGKPMGAFSHYALIILRDNPDITYNDFYAKLRQQLPSDRYPQTPQLESNETNRNSLMFQ